MDQAELNRIVSLAETASQKVNDTALKEQTYKIVLTELLRINSGAVSSSFPGNTRAAANNQQQSPLKASAIPKGGAPASKIAAWLGVEDDTLSEIFEFGDNSLSVHLAHSSLPTKAADAQRLLAHIKLAAEKIGYDSDEVAAKDLISIFDDHGCKDANLAKNLKTSEYLISKGGKGTMKTYKLRYTGMSAAQAEIKKALGVSE